MLGRRQQKELEKQQLQLAIQKHKLQQRRLAAQLAAQGRLLAQQQAQLDAMQRGGGEVSPHTLYERGGGYEIGLLASTGRATPCPADSMLLQRAGGKGDTSFCCPPECCAGWQQAQLDALLRGRGEASHFRLLCLPGQHAGLVLKGCWRS